MPELQLTKLLNLPNLEIIKYEIPDAETAVLEIRSILEVAICPTCKTPSTAIHDYDDPRLVRDLALSGRKSFLRYQSRRFECIVCQKPFRLNFLIVGLIQLAIAIYGSFKIRKRFTVYALLVLIVVYGLVYDNLSIAAGAVLAEGDLLRALNIPRYLIHALTTPTMIVAAFGALRLTGSNFAQSKTWHIIICVVTTVLIALGSYVDIFNLTLVPEVENGVTRYINAFQLFQGPPIPAVGTIIIVLIFGIILWKNTKFPWLFIASVVEFVVASAMGFILIQNLGEIAFAAGLVVTQIFAAQYQGKDR